MANLGRLDILKKSGQIERLAKALQKYREREEVLALAKDIIAKWSKIYGPVVIMRKIWARMGLDEILNRVDGEMKNRFNFEEAVFRMAVNRIIEPSSKLLLSEWEKDIFWGNEEEIALQHYYRALDILAKGKKRIEEEMFCYGRDLFSPKVDLVFFDTTSIYFEGEKAAGEIGEYGYSKDRRPDRKQIILGMVLSRDGRPIGHEIFPGATADKKAFIKVIKTFGKRFQIKRVILVGDRGMVSEGIIREIENRGYEYILGVKMRQLKKVKEEVMKRGGKFKTVTDNLRVKEVKLDGERYIICLNPEEAERDKNMRKNIIEKLQEKIRKGGVKNLIKNSQYRKFLKLEKMKGVIDTEKIKRESLYDGKYVLRTNTDLTSDETVKAYKMLWRVERAFREMKSVLDIRPIYHWNEQRVRGHIMMCFLAFVCEMVLRKLLDLKKLPISYKAMFLELRRLQIVKIDVKGKKYLVRTEIEGSCGKIFQIAGVQIPQRVRDVS
ncbi:MAG: IS1634 family transposase [Elusimicrobia bacterium]|nr:IS1634 family transposase [Elusimicrobiota bacterium]